MRPDFLIIGAMKAGTTALFRYLDEHPQVWMPPDKELHFFVESQNWPRGVRWYEDQFAPAPSGAVVGEASPSYTGASFYPGVPARIASVVPDARLVYLVRHPIDRMRSMYLHQVHVGVESRPMHEAFEDDDPYLLTSCYRWQLDHYLEHFDRSQILIRTSEALRADRATTVGDVYRFLGVDAEFVPPSLDREIHRTASKRRSSQAGDLLGRVAASPVGRLVPSSVRRVVRDRVTPPVGQVDTDLTDELRDRLAARLAPDVERLRELMDSSFDGWGIA